MKRQTIYVALTTINEQTNGWTCIAAGNDREAVETAARRIIGHPATDIYADTETKNLFVVSRSEAKRRVGFSWNNFVPVPVTYGGRYEWIK